MNCIHSLRIQSSSVLNSVQEGMQEHVVRKKSRWFVEGFFNGETKHLHGCLAPWSIRNGLEWSAITELEGWEQGTNSSLFPPRRQFSPSVQSSRCPGSTWAFTPQKVAPELLSPWLSTEPPRAQPQEALKFCWHRQGCGGSTGEKVVCWVRG